MFAFGSEDWAFVELVAVASSRLHDGDEPATARLGLRRTLHRLPSGRELAYTRPALLLTDRRSW